METLQAMDTRCLMKKESSRRPFIVVFSIYGITALVIGPQGPFLPSFSIWAAM